MQKYIKIDHPYKVGDKVMLNNNAALKYETPYKDPFGINQCWANVTVLLQFGAVKVRYKIRHIKRYIYIIQMLNLLNVEKYL